MPASLRLRPPGRLNAELRPPGSKSLSNRALLLAAMAEGTTIIRGLLDAEDTQVMLHCLTRLGIWYQRERPGQSKLEDGLSVEGTAGRMGGEEAGPRPSIDVGTAGTVARFLTAALAAAPRPSWSTIALDGSPRMRERPMDTLLEALIELGAQIDMVGKPGALPCRVHAGRGLQGGKLTFEELASSQFVSALVIAGSWARLPLRLVLRKGTPSKPYVDMTISMLAQFGGKAEWAKPERGELGEVIEIQPGELKAPSEPVLIEPDASAASYLLALPVIWGGSVTVPDLGSTSVQGDAKFYEILGRFGADVEQTATTTRAGKGNKLRGRDLELGDMPDLTLTAAVVALFADSPTRLRGVGILRHHESDRLAAAATELRKLGATVHEHHDGLEIHPPEGGPRAGVAIDTYQDHRMAMAFSLVGDVEIRDPDCVKKTYPGYWDVLQKLGMHGKA
ncbi:3-phosphoshikimate 1-carboxyvinyltransferase [Nannocystaceae bacterium ST9]